MCRPKQFIFAVTTLAIVCATSQAFAIGLLIPDNSSVRPFDVESHRVDVTVTNNAAVTKVEQVFRNHTDRPMEAQFVFPVPRGATVSDFSLWINGKKTKGAVLDRKQARQIYEDIVRRVRDPGLVEYMDGRLFKASIFPIPPGGTQKLELKFGQVLEKRGGLYRYTYPVSAGRKYVTATTQKDLTITVNAQSPIPINAAYSPTHKVSVHRDSDNKVTVGTEQLHAELDHDFQLYLGYSESDVGVNLMTWDPDGKSGEDPYFMMALAPRFEAKAHDEIGQTYTFVMDTSGSMNGDKIEQARKTLKFCLQRLEPQDHFNVIRFSTAVDTLFSSPMKASKDTKERGEAYAQNLEAAGGTAIEPALQKALGQKTNAKQPHQIIFVTDGTPTVGETNTDKILAAARSKLGSNGRLFTFGVGYDVNTRLLDGLANHGRGKSDYVKPDENMEDAVSALYTRISAPVLSDIDIDFGGARTYDVFPNPVPDLFQGDQIVLFGRFRKPFGKPLKVTGTAGGQKKTFEFGGGKGETESADPEDFDTAPLEFIPKLWATRKVGFLVEQIRLNGEKKELVTEVTRLGKKFGLVTPYTSYLAVDDSEFDRRGRERRHRTSRDVAPSDGDTADSLAGATGGGSEDAPEASPKLDLKSDRSFDPFSGGDDGKRMRRESLSEESGKSAVETSETTRKYKEAKQVEAGESAPTRWIAGTTFELDDDVWVQDGLDKDASAKKVEVYSKAYFSLLRKHPEFEKIAKLGDNVVFKLDGRVYRLAPADE